MVWKDTNKIGTAIATNDSLTVVVVLYFPRGNIEGQFMNNVSLTTSKDFIELLP